MANNNEAIFAYIDEVVSAHNLSKEDVSNILKYAFEKAYTKIYTDAKLDILIDFDKKDFIITKKLTVVDDKYFDEEGNDDCEISLSEALKKDPNIKIGDVVTEAINPRKFENTMIRNILQLFKQRVSETTNSRIYEKWKDKKGTIISGRIEMTDNDKNFSFVEFHGTKGFVSSADKIPGEYLENGKTYKFYVKDVKEQTKGWPIILSRSVPGFVEGLIKLEVPEVAQDIITIENIVRVAGFKTKVAVKSNNPNIDPVSTCIGQRRNRIEAVLREVGNKERIEFIKYNEDPIKYIARACSPARILGLDIISQEEKTATIVANSDAISLIIGSKGKNIHLISSLTGWNLDVKSLSDANKENISYTPIDPEFYETNRSRRVLVQKFASTDEILRRLENSESIEEIEKTFDLKNNETIDNKSKLNTTKEANQKQEENLVNEVVVKTKPKPVQKQEQGLSEEDVKALENSLNSTLLDDDEPKKKPKVDYSKLNNNHNHATIDSKESILGADESNKTTVSKKKKNNKNDNKQDKETSKLDKKSILDEFDDIDADYLLDEEDDNDYDDVDTDSYDDYDSDDYDK